MVEAFEDLVEVALALLVDCTTQKIVIQLHVTARQVLHDLAYETLESLAGIPEPEAQAGDLKAKTA